MAAMTPRAEKTVQAFAYRKAPLSRLPFMRSRAGAAGARSGWF